MQSLESTHKIIQDQLMLIIQTLCCFSLHLCYLGLYQVMTDDSASSIFYVQLESSVWVLWFHSSCASSHGSLFFFIVAVLHFPRALCFVCYIFCYFFVVVVGYGTSEFSVWMVSAAAMKTAFPDEIASYVVLWFPKLVSLVRHRTFKDTRIIVPNN